ncbi:MAG: glycosyltransferase family 9 protein [Verrucomicrobia bacterium]|nr:glycosyltransferase family 9 protein [Verrucomicrobiota bacterium]
MKSKIQHSLLALAYGAPRKPEGGFRPKKIRKLLVIRRNGIGDMICALPLLRNLHAAWPHVQLDVLASEKNACVLDNLGLANQVFLYRRGAGLFRNHYLNLRRLLKPVRQEDYDLVIAVKGGFSSLLAVIAYATRIPWRLGYVPSSGHSLDFCFNLKIELPREREHQVESCLRFLEPLGICKTACDLSLRLASAHEQYAEDVLQKAGVANGAFILFNVSSERCESRWTPAAVASTAVQLLNAHNLPMILCGLPRDREFLNATRRLAPSAIREAVEPPGIHHFAALVARSRFLMCGDGGPMHVAAAVRKPVFVLFSATDPQIWKPYGVPFAYSQKGRFVADIPASEVISKIQEWLPGLP